MLILAYLQVDGPVQRVPLVLPAVLGDVHLPNGQQLADHGQPVGEPDGLDDGDPPSPGGEVDVQVWALQEDVQLGGLAGL